MSAGYDDRDRDDDRPRRRRDRDDDLDRPAGGRVERARGRVKVPAILLIITGVIGLLLAMPAGLALIAALRGSRPMFVAAGVLCVLQSIVGAFSGVTLGFLIPGILLIALGLERPSTDSPRPTRRREWLAAVLGVDPSTLRRWSGCTACSPRSRGTRRSPLLTSRR